MFLLRSVLTISCCVATTGSSTSGIISITTNTIFTTDIAAAAAAATTTTTTVTSTITTTGVSQLNDLLECGLEIEWMRMCYGRGMREYSESMCVSVWLGAREICENMRGYERICHLGGMGLNEHLSAHPQSLPKSPRILSI